MEKRQRFFHAAIYVRDTHAASQQPSPGPPLCSFTYKQRFVRTECLSFTVEALVCSVSCGRPDVSPTHNFIRQKASGQPSGISINQWSLVVLAGITSVMVDRLRNGQDCSIACRHAKIIYRAAAGDKRSFDTTRFARENAGTKQVVPHKSHNCKRHTMLSLSGNSPFQTTVMPTTSSHAPHRYRPSRLQIVAHLTMKWGNRTWNR